MISRLIRVTAYASLLVLAIASWTPKALMVRSGHSAVLEHAVAYAITAAVFALAYPAWPKWRIALGLCLYAALLEVGQILVPGRGPALTDWVTGAAGACIVLIPLWLGAYKHESLRGLWPRARDYGSRLDDERSH